MELEMVLNELSLQPVAEDVLTARRRMVELISTMSAATRSGVSRVLRTHRDLNAEELASGYPIAQWRNDHDVDRDVRRFFTSLATKAPYLVDINDSTITDRAAESDFLYHESPAMGLGTAYLLDNLAISIRSVLHWHADHLDITYRYLDSNGEILEETVNVTHASHKDHILEHSSWIKAHLNTTINSGLDIWQQRERLFPNLQFCDSVGETLQQFTSGNSPLHLVVKKLLELERFCVQWQELGGAFELKNMPLKGSVESDATLQMYSREHTFRCPDGIERVFSLHVRINQDWRLHYYPLAGQSKLIIGYIGEHLRTKKYS